MLNRQQQQQQQQQQNLYWAPDDPTTKKIGKCQINSARVLTQATIPNLFLIDVKKLLQLLFSPDEFFSVTDCIRQQK
jgi:hypothetical protein